MAALILIFLYTITTPPATLFTRFLGLSRYAGQHQYSPREEAFMHYQHSHHARAYRAARHHLPTRERLRLAHLFTRKTCSLAAALLCAVPLVYLLAAVLYAQP